MSDSTTGPPDPALAVHLETRGPFDYGMSTTGQVLVRFYLGGLYVCVAIPAADVDMLKLCLDQAAAIQQTLATQPPPQGAH